MHALAPLLFILIGFRNQQLKDDKLYRANVFSLVGMCYFFFLQYIYYWYKVFNSDSWTQYLPGFCIVLIFIGIALSPWNKKSHILKTVLLCSLFLLSVVITFTSDRWVKEQIAELGGYFNTENGIWAEPVNPLKNSDITQLDAIEVQLNIPSNWQVNQLDSGHVYFIKGPANQPLLELRPNCLGELTIDTPTLIDNLLSLSEANQQDVLCSKIKQNKECIVKIHYNDHQPVKQKWYWLWISPDNQQNLMADALFYESNELLEREIVGILQSIKPLAKRQLPFCTTPALWL